MTHCFSHTQVTTKTVTELHISSVTDDMWNQRRNFEDNERMISDMSQKITNIDSKEII
jgi:hypothetical protein